MQLDLTTFVLEIINFLVLVWILRRFFFKPISSVIDQRRKATQDILDEAGKKEHAALALKAQYEARNAEWNSERESARNALDQELAKVRATRLDALQTEMRAERERLQAQQLQQQRQMEFRQQQQALALAMKFASKLLTRIASPEVESRLIDAAVEDIGKIRLKNTLHQANDAEHAAIRVFTAFPLAEPARAAILRAIAGLSGDERAIEFATDNALIAGIRILIGAHIIDANVGQELRLFAEGAADDAKS